MQNEKIHAIRTELTAEEILNCSYSERKKTHHDVGSSRGKYAAGMKTLDQVLSSANTKDTKNSIYIHVPYCKKICSFCNMRRTINPVPEDYANLVVQQIENYGKTEYVKTSKIKSVYFGGGTPTALPAHQLALILQALHKNFNIEKDAEVSAETTVSELDSEKLKVLFENGLNRLSIGVQTFDDKGRETLGRIGGGAAAEALIKKAFQTGFKNVNIDIIYNYPGETEEILKSDLKRAFDLDIAGFSFYSLIVTDNTKIGRGTNHKEYSEKTFGSDASFFAAAINEAKKAGYGFLEITKLVKPGRDNYEYIRISHRGGDVFPVGAGAGGSINNTGFMNPLDKDKFASSICTFDKTMGMAVKAEYKRLSGFSSLLQEGIINVSVLTAEEKEKTADLMETLKADKLIEKDESPENYVFTDKGFFWGNSIAADFSKNLA